QRRISFELATCVRRELAGRDAILAKKSVRMTGEPVASLARVDHQHGPACPYQLQGGGHSRIAPADDDDVVVHGQLLLRRAAACRRAKSAARSASVISGNRFSSSASASAKVSSSAAFTDCSTRHS